MPVKIYRTTVCEAVLLYQWWSTYGFQNECCYLIWFVYVFSREKWEPRNFICRSTVKKGVWWTQIYIILIWKIFQSLGGKQTWTIFRCGLLTPWTKQTTWVTWIFWLCFCELWIIKSFSHQITWCHYTYASIFYWPLLQESDKTLRRDS
jgi:hypothetical protein